MIKLFKKFSLVLAVFTITAVLLSACASNSSGKKQTPLKMDSAIKEGCLDNGMTYLIRKNSIPENRISLRLVVKAGSAMEEEDQKGVAHLVEHLAFNGTENFEKNEIINYFEKIGMNFGADLNAYTSFEQTVYMLEIPADDPKILETAMLILHDWACAVTFSQEEIDKERGVVTEEWRLGQGLQGRITNTQYPFLLKDSIFADRLPIGSMDVIKNVSRQRILDFYKKWYRPELMTVVVVGDAETEVLEKALKTTMSVIPASDKKVVEKKLKVPVRKDKALLTVKDAEMPYTNIVIYNQIENFAPRATEEEFKDALSLEIAASIFNSRLSEISNSSESPWLDAGAGETDITNYSVFDNLYIVPKTGMFTSALKKFFDECDRFVDFGVTENELNRMKQLLISQIQLSYENKDKIDNSNHAANLVSYALINKIQISQDDYLVLYKKIVPSITAENVNQAAKKAFGNRGKIMYTIAPQTETLPTDSEILDIWENYKNSEISAYEDDVSDDNLMTKPVNKGSVVSKKNIKELGAKEYVLSNGIKIITKQTDFEKNIIYTSISSKGGLFKVKDEEVLSTSISTLYAALSGFENVSYNQLVKKLSTKQIRLNASIGNTSEYFNGSAKSDQVENLLQLVNLFFTQTKFTSEAWDNINQQLLAAAAAHGSQPAEIFYDKINEILYGKDDPYHSEITKNSLKYVDKDVAEKNFKERFKNPADFTYVFVGDFDEDSFIDLCCSYLGTLPTSNEFEETTYKYWNFPKGITTDTVKKGLDQQAQVCIVFGGELPAESDIEKSFKESIILSNLENLLNIKLREAIREDKSGSYGISTYSSIDGYPERYYQFMIEFGCEPNRVQELTDEVITQIKRIKSETIGSDYIEKLVETSRRNREVNLKTNSWWVNRINSELVFTYEPMWVSGDIKTITSWITPDNIQDAAKKYLNTENYVSVFLKPEK